MLRRPDDHRRNLRRPRPPAVAFPKPDQDRHVMTDAARPAVQRRFPSPPAARRSRNAMSSRSPHRPSSRRAHPRRPHPRRKSSSSRLPTRTPAALSLPPPHRRSVRDPQIPIGRAQPNSAFPPRGFLLTRLSNAGPAPSPARLQRAGVRNPSVKLPFAMTGPKTTAGKAVFQMERVVADILRLITELRPPLVRSTA